MSHSITQVSSMPAAVNAALAITHCEPTPSRITFVRDADQIEEATCVLVRLDPIWERIQNALLEADPQDVTQTALPFDSVK